MSKKQKTEVPPLPSTTAVSNPPSPDSSPTHSPRSSCADLGIHTTKQREGDALLKALLEEVRGTKQELKSEISVFYQTVERRLAQTEEKMNSILALLPFNAGGSSASPAHTSTSPSPQILSASMRADLTRQLPFLSDFNIESTSVPFVVDDLSKPILAQRFAEATRVEDMLPPTIVWANDSFCSLVKTPLYDLLGRRGQGDKRTAEMLLPYMINRGSGLTGDIMHLCHKWQKKDGKTLTLRTRNQVYYNKNGWAKWLLMVVEAAEEETPRQASPPPVPTATSPYGYPAATTPPSQFMGMGGDDWRPRNDKEPFSFSAFPSCFSSLPFSLPPRFPSEPGAHNHGHNHTHNHNHAGTIQATQPYTPYADPGASTNMGGRPDSTATKQGRGEAEMDELLSALISPNPFPAAAPPAASWDWDSEWGEGRRGGQ